jgi:cell division protein FtsL
MHCPSCSSEDPGGGKFCQRCGSPRDLKTFIEESVQAALASKFSDAHAVQTEWVAATVEKLSNWVKLFAFFVAVPVTVTLSLLAAAGYTKYSDVSDKVTKLTYSVDEKKATLDKTASQIEQTKEQSDQLSKAYAELNQQYPLLKSISDRVKALDQNQKVIIDLLHRDANLADLQPRVAELATKLLALAKSKGIDVAVSETCRTQERQEALFNNGVTKLRSVGIHGYGLAFDVARADGSPLSTADLSELGKLGESIGLTWGGDWGSPGTPHTFVEPEHFQLGSVEEQPHIFATAKRCQPAPVPAEQQSGSGDRR